MLSCEVNKTNKMSNQTQDQAKITWRFSQLTGKHSFKMATNNSIKNAVLNVPDLGVLFNTSIAIIAANNLTYLEVLIPDHIIPLITFKKFTFIMHDDTLYAVL